MKIKLTDIAELAGVSPATVSLVLNGKGRISSSTRERILDIALEQGYISDTQRCEIECGQNADAAQANEPVRTLAILSHYTFPSYSSGAKKQFFHELCDAIQDEAMSAGYRASFSLLESGETGSPNPGNFDGYILFASTLSAAETRRLLQPLADAGKPFVICDKFFPELPYDCVVSDNWYGGYLAGCQIVRQGYRDVGYFRCSSRFDNLDKRRLGFEAALAEAGLQLDPDKVYTLSADPMVCREELKSMARSGHTFPRAVFAETDYLAIDAVQALTISGVRVPEDIAIIGFDNIHSASLIRPALTTIGVHKRNIAKTLIDRLDAKFHDPTLPPQKIITPVHLVSRDSFITD